VSISGMNIRTAGEKEIVEFELEFRIFYNPNPESGSVDVRIEFPAGKHWEGVENIAEGIVSDIAACAGSVRDTIAEQWPGLTVGNITPVIITSDMSAVPDLFGNEESDEDEVLSESMQRMLERQKKLKEQRDAVTQSGPAGPSQSGGGNTPAFDDAGGNQGGGGRTVKERERETQGR
jgi:hypothetical protein